MIISKEVKFDCAHMLSHYAGKCHNVHGHTYHGKITVEGSIQESTNMVLDYNIIKTVVDKYDHAFIFSGPDIREKVEDALLVVIKQNNMRYVELKDADLTTAEVLCYYIARSILELSDSIQKVKVDLSETDGSWASGGCVR